jgi:threonine/homoserine/homoserine lactone efflux protein
LDWGSWAFLGRGAVIGFAIAAPVGPIGVLCIRRTFAEGRAAGLATGLGAATADAFYGAVAAFGLTSISAFLLGYQSWLQLAGGAFLCVLGLKTFLTRPATRGTALQGRGLAEAYATTVALTLTNPATILSFIAVFAGAGLGQQQHGTGEAGAMVAGVFLGSAAWWLLLSGFVAHWRARHPDFAKLAPGALGGAVVAGVTLGVAGKTLRRINQVSGVLLGTFGLAALVAAAPLANGL